jgi:hypothetical protein
MSDISILIRAPALDEFGIITERREQREKFARYAYTAPATAAMEAPPPAEPSLDELVRAAVEKYMGSPSAKKILERAVTSALSEQAIRWRDRRLALQEVAESAERYSIDQILEIAAQITGVEVSALQGPSRIRSIAWPRHFAMTLLHIARRDLSYPQIGKIFGGRDHTTCMHALNVSLVRCLYPECAGWYADPRAAEIFAGSEYARGAT